MNEIKHCPRCDKDKPLNEFGKSKQTKDGKNGWCLECCREVAREYRLTPAGVYQNIRGGAKFYGKHECSIIQDEFVEWYETEPKVCAYCGVPKNLLEKFLSQYTSRYARFTIDCIVPELGYAKGNLALACDKCNATKNNIFSYDEMKEIAEKYITPKWKRLAEQRK